MECGTRWGSARPSPSAEPAGQFGGLSRRITGRSNKGPGVRHELQDAEVPGRRQRRVRARLVTRGMGGGGLVASVGVVLCPPNSHTEALTPSTSEWLPPVKVSSWGWARSQAPRMSLEAEAIGPREAWPCEDTARDKAGREASGEPSLPTPRWQAPAPRWERASAGGARAAAVLCHGRSSRLMQVSEQKALEGPSGGSRHPLPTVPVVVVIDVRGSSGHRQLSDGCHRPENRQNRT